MARPFAPSDALRLRTQQALGTALELEARVLLDESPLRQAISAYLPFSDGGIETFVQDPAESPAPGGFIQARRRLGDTEADLVFVAPKLGAGNGSAVAWQRLIADACQALGAKGCQRIYVTIDEDDRYALQLLRQLGFVVHTSDAVFARPAALPVPPVGESISTAPIDGPVEVAVESLARQLSSWTERLRDGAIASDWQRYPLGGRTAGPTMGRAWLGVDGQVIGAWRLVQGRAGHWLCALASPEADAGVLIASALAARAAAADVRELPIYASARGHEPDLNLALRESGFEPVIGRFWLVKHTTVRSAEPVAKRVAWQAASLEVAPTTPIGGYRRSRVRP